jgi:alkanesulfonate monooxygenase SsuD/methylene tetrahydromethanopterin reductase-like flavin-dependent oxidoreductase (luciferase family)
MWAEDEYEYQGRSFSLPKRRVLPKPYTDPHPPLSVAAGSPGTFEKAGRLGLGMRCFPLGTAGRIRHAGAGRRAAERRAAQAGVAAFFVPKLGGATKNESKT